MIIYTCRWLWVNQLGSVHVRMYGIEGKKCNTFHGIPDSTSTPHSNSLGNGIGIHEWVAPKSNSVDGKLFHFYGMELERILWILVHGVGELYMYMRRSMEWQFHGIWISNSKDFQDRMEWSGQVSVVEFHAEMELQIMHHHSIEMEIHLWNSRCEVGFRVWMLHYFLSIPYIRTIVFSATSARTDFTETTAFKSYVWRET